ncbi:MAG: cbb3-type cytochrome c oxidase subunit II, partial [Bdellovibrionales bacterium]|nr:cbb3-type cytochrome c oxidase subunit II [Bdellovibrionales bacterium]
EYSKPGEFIYDRPFQFGSKRTGPDLHRVGGKYPHFWHYRHMRDPRSTSPASIMPPYPWLYENDLDTSLTEAKLRGMKTLGAPYSNDELKNAVPNLQQQAKQITEQLYEQGVERQPGLENKEIIALIAYLQRLGTDIKNAPENAMASLSK